MIRSLVFVLAATLMIPGLGIAGEHPKGHEHPTGKDSKKHEHPKGKKGHEHPAKKKTADWVKHKKTMKAFVRAVEKHVRAKKKEAGSFEVYDAVLGKTWKLKMKKIHKKRIARLSDDKFFACADFTTVGKKPRTELDLDFFVTKTSDGWNVDQVLVHKIAGRPRYNYNDENERVPVTARRKHEHPKKCKGKKCKGKKGHEHPKSGEHPN